MKIPREMPLFLAMPALLWQVFFLVVPLLIVCVYSFMEWRSGAVTGSCTLQNFVAVFQGSHMYILGRSLVLGCATATSCLCIAYPVAYYIAFCMDRYKPFALFLLMLPFWTNLLILTYSWFFLLEREGVINKFLLWIGLIQEPLQLVHNMGATLLVMVYCYLPFMIMPIYSLLEKVDKRLFEASADLGATGFQTVRSIIIPLSLSGIRTGFLLVFVPAFGEFAIPMLVGGSRNMVAGSLMSYYFFVTRENGLGSAFTIMASLVLIGATLCITMIFFSPAKKGIVL